VYWWFLESLEVEWEAVSASTVSVCRLCAMLGLAVFFAFSFFFLRMWRAGAPAQVFLILTAISWVFKEGEPREGVSPLCSPSDLAQSGFSWSNLCLLIPESCLKESRNPETRLLQTHGSCSLPPSPSSQGELSGPLRRIFTCLSTLHRSPQVAAEFFFPRGRMDSSLTGDHRN
ncbi:hypothetical protein GOODEAATRI_033259, partial [Goodea atripinnis]